MLAKMNASSHLCNKHLGWLSWIDLQLVALDAGLNCGIAGLYGASLIVEFLPQNYQDCTNKDCTNHGSPLEAA